MKQKGHWELSLRSLSDLGRLGLLFVGTFTTVSCGPEQGATTKVQEQGWLDSAGFVPYPIMTKLDPSDPEVPVPDLSSTGEYRPAWDASLADLLATDAYADCSINGTLHREGQTSQEGFDTYLQHLRTQADSFECEAQDLNVQFPARWVANRKSPNCNLNPQTGGPGVVDFLERGPDVVSDFRNVMDQEDWFDHATAPGVFGDAMHTATRELQYADLNLCIAQRLRSEINGGQTLFLSTKDQQEILAVIRERAQLSVMYHSLIAKILSAPAPGGLIHAADYQFPALIYNWAQQASSGALAALGENYAVAVRTHIKATQELAELLQREAGTRPRNSHPDLGTSLADYDWGIGQPRLRVLNLLYGGDPVGTPDQTLLPGKGMGGVGRQRGTTTESSIVPAYVTADMSDPRLGVLFGLARAADALLFKVNVTDQWSDEPGFDVSASATNLYQAVEANIREKICEREVAVDPWCSSTEAGEASEHVLRIKGCLPEASTELGCDLPEVIIPDVEDVEEFLLWQDHGIAPVHAERMVQAISEMVGELAKDLPTELISSYYSHRHRDGMQHILGEHETLIIGGEDWVHFDSDSRFVPFQGHEMLIDFATMPNLPKEFNLLADARQQGFVFHAVPGHVLTGAPFEKMRWLGAVGALAFAREALTEGSVAAGGADDFFDAAGEVLPELDRAVGPRTAILRREMIVVENDCIHGTFSPLDCKYLVPAEDALTYGFRVDVTTLASDPLDELITPAQSKQLHSIALDPDTVGIDGYDRSDLDAEPAHPTTSPIDYATYASGYEGRSFVYYLPEHPIRAVLLRGDHPDSSGEKVYDYVYGHFVFGYESFATAYGGSFNQLAERTMNVLTSDWSKPRYDAFGLPTNWVPPADASLIGGAPGEPAYQYYLRSASGAADQATSAVAQAIDNLVQETLLTSELEVAEQRASTISDQETRSLCGDREDCSVEMSQWSPTLPNCPSSSSQVVCFTTLYALKDLLGQSVPVAQEVLDASEQPTFPGLEGSEMERVLVRQWNALKSLELAINAAWDAGGSGMVQLDAAIAQTEAASYRFVAAQAAFRLEGTQIAASNADAQLQLDLLDDMAFQFTIDVGAALASESRECGDAEFEDAILSGQSFTGVSSFSGSREDGWRVSSDSDGDGWSPAAWYAQQDRCEVAEQALRITLLDAENQREQIQLQRDIILNYSEELDQAEIESMVATLNAAESEYFAVLSAENAARQAAYAQAVSGLLAVQQANGELAAAVAEMRRVAAMAESARAGANLERDLVEMGVATRFGLNRKYRSYDMWRARALLENSRRLAVAARRAVESHFVVELSEVNSSQAFVEAPSLWVDEVYAADLQAPAVVGLSVADGFEGTIDVNQLGDYIDNLERFVQGYAVTFPTSVAAPDTEVLLLPGPQITEEHHEIVEDAVTGDPVATGALVAGLSAVSSAWSFACPNQDTWLPHPGVGEVPLVSTLETMCSGPGAEPDDGVPPSRMKVSFSLDPWGTLNHGYSAGESGRRHNVRWRRLAVNLIGTGVRDCSAVANPQTCYSEGFLDFHLRHVGPAWAQSYSGAWMAFDLPTAFVEGGKALAVEEWLDPVVNSWTTPHVSSVARAELAGRPINGSYELIIDLPPDARPERIERVQLLVETDYWVNQQ